MRFLSVCSGIEAASVAWPSWECAAVAEIEKFPSAVLAHHYPDVPNVGDFTKIRGDEFGTIDVLVGGTPCQSFLWLGFVEGLRSSLHGEFYRRIFCFSQEVAAFMDNMGKRTGFFERR